MIIPSNAVVKLKGVFFASLVLAAGGLISFRRLLSSTISGNLAPGTWLFLFIDFGWAFTLLGPSCQRLPSLEIDTNKHEIKCRKSNTMTTKSWKGHLPFFPPLDHSR